MTHTLDIDMTQRMDLWRGDAWMWATKDLMLIEQFEPMQWLYANARAAWCWDLVDTVPKEYVLEKYAERLSVFDNIGEIRLRLTFDSVDDAILFKLTWV